MGEMELATHLLNHCKVQSNLPDLYKSSFLSELISQLDLACSYFLPQFDQGLEVVETILTASDSSTVSLTWNKALLPLLQAVRNCCSIEANSITLHRSNLFVLLRGLLKKFTTLSPSYLRIHLSNSNTENSEIDKEMSEINKVLRFTCQIVSNFAASAKGEVCQSIVDTIVFPASEKGVGEIQGEGDCDRDTLLQDMLSACGKHHNVLGLGACISSLYNALISNRDEERDSGDGDDTATNGHAINERLHLATLPKMRPMWCQILLSLMPHNSNTSDGNKAQLEWMYILTARLLQSEHILSLFALLQSRTNSHRGDANQTMSAKKDFDVFDSLQGISSSYPEAAPRWETMTHEQIVLLNLIINCLECELYLTRREKVAILQMDCMGIWLQGLTRGIQIGLDAMRKYKNGDEKQEESDSGQIIAHHLRVTSVLGLMELLSLFLTLSNDETLKKEGEREGEGEMFLQTLLLSESVIGTEGEQGVFMQILIDSVKSLAHLSHIKQDVHHRDGDGNDTNDGMSTSLASIEEQGEILKSLLQLIGNLLYRNPQNQQFFLHCGGFAAILPHCATNISIPLCREWGWLCIRNACERNTTNQSYLASLEARDAEVSIQDEYMKELGMKVKMEGDKFKLYKDGQEQ